MSDVVPPVPDPKLKPKSAADMAREGEHEDDVLVERDHSQSGPDDSKTETLPPPTTPPNGD